MSGAPAEQAPAEAYALVPARSISDERLAAFSGSVLPDTPPERLLQSWWRRADPDCAVAAIDQSTGAVAGLCVGRPSEWVIGGERHPAVAICGWYVAPDHAGRRLGHRLVRHFDAPDRLIYAYSISDDAIRSFARLGWVGPYPSSLLALPLPRVARFVHAMFDHTRGLELHDHVVDSGALPPSLGAELDRIEARLAGRAGSARMRRGSAEWAWRLGVCGQRSYRFCVAVRSGEPVGYVATRLTTPGASRMLGKLDAAIVTDLVAGEEDAPLVRALGARAVSLAGELGAAVVLASTTVASERRSYAGLGFLSSDLALLGRPLRRRAPHFMWLPQGPAATLSPAAIALSFSDSDVDLNL